MIFLFSKVSIIYWPRSILLPRVCTVFCMVNVGHKLYRKTKTFSGVRHLSIFLTPNSQARLVFGEK